MKPVRILLFANVFDKTHDLMGFLPSWVHALEVQGAIITVVAADVGPSDSGPRVVNLDKRRHSNAFGRLVRVVVLLWRHRREYDVLFVVMAPTWALLLSPLVRFMGKRAYLWYAVWRGSWKLRLAERFVNGIFCSVTESFPFTSPKVIAVGQSIDTDRFSPSDIQRLPGQILFVGRISAVKHLELLFDALASDADLLAGLSVTIAGGPVSPQDHTYERGVREAVVRLNLSQPVVWMGRVGHDTTHELYRRADIVVNMTPAGSFDKTILEAMASGAIIVASNPALRRFLPESIARMVLFREGDILDFARALSEVSGISEQQKSEVRNTMRQVVVEHHSLSRWARNILDNLA